MADFDWPEGVVPYAVSFYLQPHTGGTESPFSRKTKTYGLSAPRWVCRLAVRGGDSMEWGRGDHALAGQRMDAFLTRMKGRQNRVRLYDFRRSDMTTRDWTSGVSNNAASKGATSIVLTGLGPFAKVHAGDYLGGDGRPHIITEDVEANGSGVATVNFEPPLAANIASGAAVFGNPTGLFKLTSDDAGENMSEVGQLAQYSLEFVEDI